jgi:hypothetical protein
MNSLIYIILFTVASFLYYGVSCLISPRLIKEFERFGLSEYRIITGVLQLLGAFGIIFGLLYPLLGILAAVGLTLLMMAGFITRIKIKDNFIQTLPSFFYMVLNAYIASIFYVRIGIIGE